MIRVGIFQVDFAREREISPEAARNLAFRYFYGGDVPKEKYRVVWEKEIGELPGAMEAFQEASQDIWGFLEWLFRRFNRVEPGDVPEDFTGHSLSVGDVVRLTQGDVVRYYKVMPLGFEDITDRWNG